MGKTDNFRKQHADLVKIVGEITTFLTPQGVTQNGQKISGLLAQLTGKITVHLAMEDEALYPNILRSSDPKVRSTAEAFIKEMGGIKNVFTGYVGKWNGPAAITGNPEGFITETKQLFAALGNRINRENNELYPMVDAA